MDIETQAEITLREAGYQTWHWSTGSVRTVCFENQTVMGFVYVFPLGTDLLQGWQEAQRITLAGHAPALRAARGKAWNVYSVFLTGDPSPSESRQIERIEEDFTVTRKIARAGIQAPSDLLNALLPLLPIRSQPVLAAEDYTARLQARLGDVPSVAVTAFLGTVSAADVAAILVDTP